MFARFHVLTSLIGVSWLVLKLDLAIRDDEISVIVVEFSLFLQVVLCAPLQFCHIVCYPCGIFSQTVPVPSAHTQYILPNIGRGVLLLLGRTHPKLCAAANARGMIDPSFSVAQLFN